jgi:hypothetical protein
MKANELRIGNKVSYEGSIVTVSTISDDEVTFSDYASFDYPQIEDISGIELTEEWLVRFGAKNNNEELTIPINRHLYISCFDNSCQLVTDDDFLVMDIEYAHQLQNLYFALRGEELKQA